MVKLIYSVFGIALIYIQTCYAAWYWSMKPQLSLIFTTVCEDFSGTFDYLICGFKFIKLNDNVIFKSGFHGPPFLSCVLVVTFFLLSMLSRFLGPRIPFGSNVLRLVLEIIKTIPYFVDREKLIKHIIFFFKLSAQHTRG